MKCQIEKCLPPPPPHQQMRCYLSRWEHTLLISEWLVFNCQSGLMQAHVEANLCVRVLEHTFQYCTTLITAALFKRGDCLHCRTESHFAFYSIVKTKCARMSDEWRVKWGGRLVSFWHLGPTLYTQSCSDETIQNPWSPSETHTHMQRAESPRSSHQRVGVGCGCRECDRLWYHSVTQRCTRIW